MVQLTVHVSVSGLQVLTIMYKLILMHKRTKSGFSLEHPQGVGIVEIVGTVGIVGIVIHT